MCSHLISIDRLGPAPLRIPAAALPRELILPQMRMYSTGIALHVVKSGQVTESDLKNVHLVGV